MDRLKASKYNVFFDTDDGTHLAFNGISGALATLEDETYLSVKRIMGDPNNFNWDSPNAKNLKEILLEGYYLIEEYIDEIQLLRHKRNIGRYANNGLIFSLCPTLDCNFACPYCYENKTSGRMSQDVIDSILSFIKEKIVSIRTLQITWYGGEPLLEFSLIKMLSEKFIKICEENKCKYAATMITNGYLISPDIVKTLSELKIKEVQITIDPPKTCHDRRRALKSGKGTYDRVLANAYEVADHVQKLNLRMNSDKENVQAAIDFLDEPLFKNKNVVASLGRIAPLTPHCADIGDNCCSPLEHFEWSYKFKEKCREKGIGSVQYPPVPLAYCLAEVLVGYVVDPKGQVYKCVDGLGQKNEVVGVFTKGELQTNSYYNRWLFWDPFADQACRSCEVLPTCRGGCPSMGLHGKPLIERCSKWKYAFVEKLKHYYASVSPSCDEERR